MRLRANERIVPRRDYTALSEILFSFRTAKGHKTQLAAPLQLGRQYTIIDDMFKPSHALFPEDDSNFQLQLNDANSTIWFASVLVVPSLNQFLAITADKHYEGLNTLCLHYQQAKQLLACSPSATLGMHLQKPINRGHLKN